MGTAVDARIGTMATAWQIRLKGLHHLFNIWRKDWWFFWTIEQSIVKDYWKAESKSPFGTKIDARSTQWRNLLRVQSTGSTGWITDWQSLGSAALRWDEMQFWMDRAIVWSSLRESSDKSHCLDDVVVLDVNDSVSISIVQGLVQLKHWAVSYESRKRKKQCPRW